MGMQSSILLPIFDRVFCLKKKINLNSNIWLEEKHRSL